MTLHGFYLSSAAHRCRIAFNLKGIVPDTAPVHLRRGGGEQMQPAFRAVNPQALVPALETDGMVLTQSLAIIEWLDETVPEPPLLPADSGLRARVRAFALAIACDIHPLQNLRVLRYLKRTLGQEQAVIDDWCRHWIGDGLAACETLLDRGRSPARFAFGDTPGLADICLVPQLLSAERYGIDLTPMPRLRAVRAACDELPPSRTRSPPANPTPRTPPGRPPQVDRQRQDDGIADRYAALPGQHEEDGIGHLLGLHQAAVSERLFHLRLGPVVEERGDHRSRHDRPTRMPCRIPGAVATKACTANFEAVQIRMAAQWLTAISSMHVACTFHAHSRARRCGGDRKVKRGRAGPYVDPDRGLTSSSGAGLPGRGRSCTRTFWPTW